MSSSEQNKRDVMLDHGIEDDVFGQEFVFGLFCTLGAVTLVGILTFTVCWKHFVGGTSDFYGLCVKADGKSNIGYFQT